MFKKILIANRGEIACRVIATARRMGIKTVAVYANIDARARHVAMADEAVLIGEAAATESYLRGDRIIAAALQTGAEAIHPGYGFLSENPEFVEAVEIAGLKFIGPSPAAIRAMGLKDAAKRLMIEAGVPVVPGYHGAAQDAMTLATEAAAIGYPVLIKARAGGGGKGMRMVERPEEFNTALASARREAQSSFGDDAVLIEKFITRPRHIEMQIFGDLFGNIVHMFERDCSLQRRHQKVIEEAPAPGMTDEVRAAMGHAAIEAARAVNYVGAGTVEFIVDGVGALHPDKFWFLEMNTRLQVEHPVSEAITGFDFVELQLRIAAGQALPMAQSAIRADGWAFEARLYAEDVPAGFLPATGRVEHLRFPASAEFTRDAVRVDAGIRPGDIISPHYDPMIAKIITHAPTRVEALTRLGAAIGATQSVGATTNLEFLAALTRHDGFVRGEVDTGLIGRDLAALSSGAETPSLAVAIAALIVAGHGRLPANSDPWARLRGFRVWDAARDFVCLCNNNSASTVILTQTGPSGFAVAIGAATLDLELIGHDAGQLRITHNGRQFTVDFFEGDHAISVFLDGRTHRFICPDPLAGDQHEDRGGDALAAPMPGMIRAVNAAKGAAVKKGDALIVIEAMKMEQSLIAPRDGTVAEVMVESGDQVESGATLLALEPENGK